MPNTLVILPEAREKTALAFEWYEEQILGLGYEFIRSVDSTLRMIDREPIFTQSCTSVTTGH
jgi:hypothetical protein